MKRILMIAALFTAVVAVKAQESFSAYALTKPGVVVDYAYYAASMSSKPSLMGYVRTTVKAIEKDGGNDVVITNNFFLNRKKKPSKNAAFAGFADGLDARTSFWQGACTMTDILFQLAGTVKSGFFLKIPAVLKVGDKLESGSIVQTTKFPMTREVQNNISFDDFTVTAEEDVETNAGVFHCMRIDGKLNGSFQTVKLKDTCYTLWISQNVGLVKVDTDYYKVSLVIDTVEGL